MVPKCEIEIGKVVENQQPAKFYGSEIKLIYSTSCTCSGFFFWGGDHYRKRQDLLLGRTGLDSKSKVMENFVEGAMQERGVKTMIIRLISM